MCAKLILIASESSGFGKKMVISEQISPRNKLERDCLVMDYEFYMDFPYICNENAV